MHTRCRHTGGAPESRSSQVRRRMQMMNGAWSVLALLVLLSGRAIAGPVGLNEAYRRALQYDAKYRAAEEKHAADREEIGKARAGFRPSLRASASVGRNATESTTLATDVSEDFFYNTYNYSVVLKQPLFNMAQFDAYSQSKAVVRKSEALLRKEESALAVRIVQAYVNILYAEDNLEYSRAQVEAAKEQLQQAKKRYATGYGTITEINEAKARYDIALAEGLEYNHTLEFSRRELESIIGLYPDSLRHLDPAKSIFTVPDPHDADAWIAMAAENNAELDASRYEVRIAEKQVDRQRASRYPTFDLYASRTFSESDNNYSIGSQYDTYALNVQMSLPIYSGGYVSASVRQSAAQVREANEKLLAQERLAGSNVRKYFNGVVSSIAQIRAYEQAVTSGGIALTGTKKGFLSGLRSNVDVLDAQEKFFESKRNLAKARYQYILNLILLKDAAGVLSGRDIEEFEGWLK